MFLYKSKSLLLPFVFLSFLITRTVVPLLPHCCSVTTNAQGDEGEKMEAVIEYWTKRRIRSLCAPFTQMCGPPDDDDDSDDFCWLSLDTHYMGSLPDQEGVPRRRKETVSFCFMSFPKTKNVATALLAHSGFLSAAFCCLFHSPDSTNPPPTVVKVLKKHREGPSP